MRPETRITAWPKRDHTMAEPDLTPAEREIVDAVAARKGEDWAYQHVELILAQARRVGEL